MNEKLSPYLKIFNEYKNFIPEDKMVFKFEYKLDSFQNEGMFHIHNEENILISCPTGTGKTSFAIYSIAYWLKKNKKIIYTVPIKVLSNEKFYQLKQIFGSENIGITTGDIKLNPNAPVIIMTTEILRNILFRYSSSSQYKISYSTDNSLIDINEVGSVIFDEVHYIMDPQRGVVWEQTIIMLPKNINLVMLSASISNPHIFCSWIGNLKQVPINLITTNHRVVPLRYYFWKSTLIPPKDENISKKEQLKFDLIEILDEKKNYKNFDIIKHKYIKHDIKKIMDKLVDFLVEENLTPAIFFKFSRKKCESICYTVRKNLLSYEEIAEVENTFNHYMKDYKGIYEKLPQYQDIYKQLLKGVVYHHSGLIPILKEIIEILYSKKLVKILFATETYAIGVNSPTKTVLFTEMEKYDNDGLRYLRQDEMIQISGRCGRRGIDPYGTVILLPCFDLPPESIFKNILTGKSPILQSKFKLTYQFVLKTLCSDTFDIANFLSKTFMMDENDKQVLIHIAKQKELEEKLNNINIDENFEITIKNYDKINSKLNDTFFTLKKKDKDKLEKEKNQIENNPDFKNILINYNLKKDLEKELNNINIQIWNCNNSLLFDMNLMIKLLKQENYIESIEKTTDEKLDNISNYKIMKKGIIAMGINECNEILFTEMINQGLFDDLEFPEIVSLLSSLINERDQNNEEKFITNLSIPKIVNEKLNKLVEISEYFLNLESKLQINIGSDYKIYLDYVESSYIWANGGTVNEVYEYTTVYDGNFVKAIMRINNICENLNDICMNIERYDICSKMEGFTQKLIRDVTTINSLYI